jgi:predicted amidohydrolase YtcJ
MSGKSRRFVIAAATVSFFSIAACTSPTISENSPIADTVFTNGKIYTVDKAKSWAEAVAVTNGKIVYVGATAGAAAFTGPSTKQVDLKGRLMLPGFSDTHNHAYLRTENLFWVTLPAADSLDQYRQAIRDYLAKNPNAKQLRGVGWRMNFIIAQAEAQGKTPAALLDDLVGRDIPAVIITHGHHQIWANTRAIRNAGASRARTNPMASSKSLGRRT